MKLSVMARRSCHKVLFCHRFCLLYMLMTSVLCVNQDPIYADDILLLAPTVTALEKLLHACERELI